ncbi:gliding motility-associated C-terminal domain-containing protein [Pedobacter ginsengisoli]|uniref:gliding motility-associated C-terminal domain-containing protein n=1 Tax=Pedobacter ginsengisoli TaxID=363852 RepID=UPI00254BAD43|nr:gliding motility-associated C-terminal domain-containing protein [Pedobacter ginsengisoli]
MRNLLLLFWLTFGVHEVDAAIFTVTSNGNAGPGSLREAIVLANTNGTATTDYIHFDLPGNAVLDVTIQLSEELPILTSNVVVDGTTQPFAVLGNSSVKIGLIRVVPGYFNGLRLDNANHIEIYGISFSNFKSDPLGSIDDKKAGIFLYNCANIIIGTPGKQNCFTGNYAGILSPFVVPRRYVERIKISSNIFGLAEDGISPIPNETGIDISFIKNGIIGGDTRAEGNLITANTKSGIALGGAEEAVKVANNVIGLDKTLIKNISTLAATGVYINGATSIPVVSDNIIVSQNKALLLDYVNGGFLIAGNRIGAGLNGTESFGNNIGIHINFSLDGIIGGLNTNAQNVIAYNKTAIVIEISYPISILRNSIYCNTESSIKFTNLPQGKSVTPSTISSITSTSASGVYLPNSFIELFYDDECPDCQGKTWIATIPTSANGSWVYNGTLTGGITSTGTNADGATSSFSKPLLFDQGKTITTTFCGSSKGSIKGISISNASFYKWYTEAGQPVRDDQDLVDVEAGNYYLEGGQPGSCIVRSPIYTIPNKDIVYKAKNFVIVPANCDTDNGSITIMGYESEEPEFFEWKDEKGTVVDNRPALTGMPAGKYFLSVSGHEDCSNLVGEFVVPEAAVPSIDLSGLIKNSTCDGRLVSGAGIQVKGSTGPYNYAWMNEQGGIVGNGLELKGVAPGKYFFKVTDQYSCVQTSPLIDFTDIGKKALVVPNSISPNGDGINDTWKIQGAESYAGADFSVFNRYGERVFYSRGYTQEFDGTMKGKHLPAGVYYYIIDLKGDCPNLTGSLTIIK